VNPLLWLLVPGAFVWGYLYGRIRLRRQARELVAFSDSVVSDLDRLLVQELRNCDPVVQPYHSRKLMLGAASVLEQRSVGAHYEPEKS
jgi:hypothetical protein